MKDKMKSLEFFNNMFIRLFGIVLWIAFAILFLNEYYTHDTMIKLSLNELGEMNVEMVTIILVIIYYIIASIQTLKNKI